MADPLQLSSTFKEAIQDILRAVDNRVLRLMARLDAPVKEFSLQFGQAVPDGQTIPINAPATVIVPWDADIFRFRLWCTFSCSITVTIHRAPTTDPQRFATLSDANYVADPVVMLEDSQSDPTTRQFNLSATGLSTALYEGDIVSITPTTILGVAAVLGPDLVTVLTPAITLSYWGAELVCRLRTVPLSTPVSS